MAILWAGAEDIDFPERNGVTLANSVAAAYRSAFARGYLVFASYNQSWVKTPAVTDAGSMWFSAQMLAYNNGNLSAPVIVFFRGGTEVFRIRTGAATWGLFEVYQNSTVRAAAATAFLSSTLYKIDVHYFKDAAGWVRVYRGGTLWIEYAGDTSAWGDVDQVQVISPLSAGYTFMVSECILATQDTRVLSVRTLSPTSAGDTNGWDGGTYADVDELEVDTGDVLYSGTAGQEAQLGLADMPAGTYNVMQVRVSAMAVRGPTGPSQLGLGVRAGGANYYGSNQAVDVVWGVFREAWDLNPSNGAGWSGADVNALQISLRTAT